MSFLPPSLKVFAGIYPLDQSEYVSLRTAIDKLTLNDSSVAVHRDSSIALGQGWRVGFLGLLHMDVFRQRLEEVCHDRKKEGEGGRNVRNKDKKRRWFLVSFLIQEYDASVIVTSPSVPYRGVLPW